MWPWAVIGGEVVCVAAGCVLAAFALYLLLLSVAALFFSPGRRQAPSARLTVLIPAHNEALLVGRCIGSLRAQTYPSELYDVVVIADNCTDDTAAVAAAAGASRVLVREVPDARGKGHALRWAMDRVLTDDATDAVVVVDADSVAQDDFLATLVQPLLAGAQAVQGESLLYEDGTSGTALRVLAFLLVNRVRPTGRAVLRLPATHLAGNGMLLARDLLLDKPWGAFTSAEDLEYSLHLQVTGVRIAFARGAILLSPTAPNAAAGAQQQLRWEGGKAHLARTWIPRLVRRAFADRRISLLGLAFDLALPPLGLLAAGVIAGSVASAGLVASGALAPWVLIPWLSGLGAIALHVLVGMRAGRAPRSAYGALVGAPWFIATKALRAHRLLTFGADTWVRTERGSTEVGRQ
jgi:1,2-diacylglycerol 3-beta-glucosyltransferase